MVLDGRRYFKLAYLKAITRGELSILRRKLKYYETVKEAGHVFNETDLSYIEEKLNRRFR